SPTKRIDVFLTDDPSLNVRMYIQCVNQCSLLASSNTLTPHPIDVLVNRRCDAIPQECLIVLPIQPFARLGLPLALDDSHQDVLYNIFSSVSRSTQTTHQNEDQTSAQSFQRAPQGLSIVAQRLTPGSARCDSFVLR